jgi:ATP-dependent DNA ligase
MVYKDFRYIYPPRPKNACPPSEIQTWDDGQMIAQPKINGSNCVIFMNEEKTHIYNRHGERMNNFKIDLSSIRDLYRGKGWMVLNGEYLNKNKKDDKSESFNEKLVLFDILVFEDQHLIGSNFKLRVELLDSLYDQSDYNEYLTKISNEIFKVKSYESNFREIYNYLVKVDLVEGLVLKRKSGRLEIGNTENNNTKSQVKFRKPTKNYKF